MATAQAQSVRRKRCYNAENGAMFFARLTPKRPVDLKAHPIIADSLQPASIWEIDGPLESGKTSVLIDIAARCVLPTLANGLEMNVAFIDCDGQFHIDRLISFIERRLGGSTSTSGEARVDEEKVTAALARFHYVACNNSDELFEALDLFDTEISSTTVTENGGGWILLIDGINSFYWLDRTSMSRANINQIYQKYAHRINRFVSEHNLPAIVTKLTIEVGQDDDGQESTDAQQKSDKDSSSKVAVSCVMDANWRKLIKSSVQLSVMEVGDQVVHRAIRDNQKPVQFEIDEGGVTYLG